jgi:hypothetical protein
MVGTKGEDRCDMTAEGDLVLVRECCDRIADGSGDPAIYEAVARHWVAAMSQGADLGVVLDPRARASLVRHLIEQDTVAVSPPALHTALANSVTGGLPDVLPAAVSQVDDVLAVLAADEHPGKNTVLLLLLLRAHLSDRFDQTRISDLHMRAIADFTTDDLTLPYSVAYTRAFDENRADVMRLLNGQVHGWSTDQLPVPHLLVFEWLTGRPGGTREGLKRRVSAPGETPAATRTESVSAARSLIIHHRLLDELENPSPEVVEPSFTTLYRGVAARAAILPARQANALAAHRIRRRMDTKVWQAAFAASGLVRARTPQALQRRRPKVAVCVSGQLRGYRAALATWRRTLLRTADCDLFVHTWKAVGRSSGEAFRATLPFGGESFGAEYRSAANRIGFEEIKQRYPHLFASLARSSTVDSDELRALYETDHVVVEDDTVPPRDGWTNQDKMHAKIEAAFELIAPSPDEYDLVVRIRPDKAIRLLAFRWNDALEICRSSPTILADGAYTLHYANLFIGDQFALGHPSAMAIYSRTWSIYPTLAANKLFRCPQEFLGHGSLAQVCWAHGIDVRRMPIRFGDLLEAAPMGSQEILGCLREDAAGRDDATDRALIAAALADLAR